MFLSKRCDAAKAMVFMASRDLHTVHQIFPHRQETRVFSGLRVLSPLMVSRMAVTFFEGGEPL
jgi:hypothetical protein